MDEKILPDTRNCRCHPVRFRIKLQLEHPFKVLWNNPSNGNIWFHFHSPATLLPGSR